MLTTKQINDLLGVEESFHAPYKLAEIMKSEDDRNNLFEQFLKLEADLSYDWFLNYYQAEHSDRKGKGQDFTPDSIAKITSGILGNSSSNLDICCGVGGLTIKRYVDNPNQKFYCEELSDRAIPFLLFNLAIRNIEGIVKHGDSLTRQFKEIYRLKKGDKFSIIRTVEKAEEIKTESVIMNPPYSLNWLADKKYLEEDRFKKFETLAPKSKADYAFLLTGLHQLSESGKMAIILPHGVLFRGGAEETIRRKLIELNLIESVIGLPPKVFYNTDIPTVILVLRKDKEDEHIFFIDASEEFKHEPPKNVLEEKHINKILETYRDRKEIDRFSRTIKINEIADNGFNLNIPRYIDKYVKEYVPPLSDILKDLIKIDKEIELTQLKFAKMANQLVSEDLESNRELKDFAKYLKNRRGANQGGQISFYD